MSIRFHLAHYEIMDELGHGGMGVVYLARDTLLGRSVAIKVLPTLMQSDPERRGRFVREARAAAALNHPNIATVYEVGEAMLEPKEAEAEGSTLVGGDGGITRTSGTSCLYIAMEYVAGEDLHKRLNGEPMPVEEALNLAVQMADALEVAHHAGVIHRDLKPRNIRVTPDGRVKILDFGLAKVIQEDAGLGSVLGGAGEEVRTIAGMIVGTVPYMAPEQVEGKEVDARSDLFALGVVLYQMLTGDVPFEGAGLVQYVRALSASRPEPPSTHNPSVPAGLDRIVARLLARESGERYASAGRVAQALRELLGSGELSGNGAGLEYNDPTEDSSHREKALSSGYSRRMILAVAIASVLGMVAFLIRQHAEQSSEDDLTSTLFVERVDTTVGPDLVNLCKQARDGFLEFFSVADSEVSLVLDAVADRVRAKNGLLLGFRCGSEQEREYVQVVLSAAFSSRLLWSQKLQPRGGFGSDIWAEVAFVTTRAIRAARHFYTLDASERGLKATSLYLEIIRRIEQSVRPQDLLEAMPYVAEAEELFENSAKILALRNQLLWRARRILDEGEIAALNASSERALAVDREDFDSQLAKMRTERFLGNVATSVEIGYRLVKLHPRVPSLHHALGTSLWWSSELTLAEEQYFEAVKLRRGYWRYWNDLASLRKRMGDLDGARDALDRTARLAPREALWTLENVAVAALAAGDLEEAKELLGQIAEHEQTSSVASNLGAVAYLMEDFQEALRHYERAVRLESNNPRFTSNLGDAAWMTGDRGRGVESYMRAATLIAQQCLARGWGLGPAVQNTSHAISLAERAAYLGKGGDCTEALQLAGVIRDRVFEPEPDPSILLYYAGALAQCNPNSRDLQRTVERAIRSGVLLQRISLGVEFQAILSQEWLVALLNK